MRVVELVGQVAVAAAVRQAVDLDEEVVAARIGALLLEVDVDDPVAVGVEAARLPAVEQRVAVGVDVEHLDLHRDLGAVVVRP